MNQFFNFSIQGTSHKAKDIPCQDYSLSLETYDIDGNQYIIAAEGDGVGSCSRSSIGSEMAVKTTAYTIRDKVSKAANIDPNYMEEILRYSFKCALDNIEERASKDRIPFTEYDTTLTVAVSAGDRLWFGHIGDDGIVAMFADGSYDMITKRHKGEEHTSVYPLRNTNLWQFGYFDKNVASVVLMTDGVLDFCVDNESLNNRVLYPFLEPVLRLTETNKERISSIKDDWMNLFNGTGDEGVDISTITDDITFSVIWNPDVVRNAPEIQFDYDGWNLVTKQRREEQEKALYKDFLGYIENLNKDEPPRCIELGTKDVTVSNNQSDDVLSDIFNTACEVLSLANQTGELIGDQLLKHLRKDGEK